MLESALAHFLTIDPRPYRLDGLTPRAAVCPRDAEEVSRLLRLCHQEGWAVVPWGGGQHQGLGRRLEAYDVAVLMSGLDQIIDHQPADLTLTAQAGATLAAVQRHLAASGQGLPLEAEDPEKATLGGLLSAGLSGPMRCAYGTGRDALLGIEAVQPDGTLVRGGARVVKSVAGYDMPKLFWASLGSAGILTAVTLKVQPLPPSRFTVLLGFEALDWLEPIWGELTSGRWSPSLVTLVQGPRAWGEPFSRARWALALGADGQQETTEWQVERFLALGRESLAMEMMTFDAETSLQVRQALMAFRAQGDLALKLCVRPSQVPSMLQILELMSPLGIFVEAAQGVIRVSWRSGAPEWREAAELGEAFGGTWQLERCPIAWKEQGFEGWGPPRGDFPLMQRLKLTMDPKRILSPGRLC